jgi:hypothetical protein
MDKKKTRTLSKETIIKFIDSLQEKSLIYTVLIFFLIFLGFYIIWSPLYYRIFENLDVVFMATPNETIMKQSFYKQILSVVILAPLLETLIFQKWLYRLLSSISWLKKNKILITAIGASVFGLMHPYSLFYIIYNFFAGTLFMSAYIIRLNRSPYLTVAALHALMNLFSICIDPIEKMIFM